MYDYIDGLTASIIDFVLWLAPQLERHPADVALRVNAYWAALISICLFACAITGVVVLSPKHDRRSRLFRALAVGASALVPGLAVLIWDAVRINETDSDLWDLIVFRKIYPPLWLAGITACVGLILYVVVRAVVTRLSGARAAAGGLVVATVILGSITLILKETVKWFPNPRPWGAPAIGKVSEFKVPREPRPPAGATPASDKDTINVYFGSTRRKAIANNLWTFDRGRGNELSLGVARITIPLDHKRGRVEAPAEYSVFGVKLYSQATDPNKHFSVARVSLLSEDDFVELGFLGRDSAILFIHGFNVLFDAALFRTAQIANDLEFSGRAYLFSWPSRGGVENYISDLSNAEYSQPYLKKFLELILRSGVERIHIIAHSMGNLPLMRVMRELSASLSTADKARVRQIILASPDVDEGVFEQLAAAMSSFGGATLYASEADRALQASQFLGGNENIRRAGAVTNLGPVVIAGIDAIDASQASMEWFSLNHSGYAESPALLTDISILIRCGTRPPVLRSKSFEEVSAKGGSYWKLKPGTYSPMAQSC